MDPPWIDGPYNPDEDLLIEIQNLQDKVRDREEELYRVRTTEIQAAIELDTYQNPEQRAKFQETCNTIAQYKKMIDDLMQRKCFCPKDLKIGDRKCQYCIVKNHLKWAMVKNKIAKYKDIVDEYDV